MKSSSNPPDSLESRYRKRYVTLERLAHSLSEILQEYVGGEPRIDSVSARAKDVDRFLQKASSRTNGKQKYDEPLSQIQDQIGARIVVFYKSDVDRIDKLVKRYFRAIEYRKVVPDSETEFGYFGHHLVLILPNDIIEPEMEKSDIPEFFELQIKTLFQHAWSEANHDLGYKPGARTLDSDAKRKLAFTSAQAWGADLIFDELFRRPAS